MASTTLTSAQRDRAAGVLLATAAGDALGAGYEFNAPMPADRPVGMIGGGLGPFAPGEWTDDTSMAIAIAEITAAGADLRSERALDRIVDRWCGWARTAKDVGVQTSAVLSAAASADHPARAARRESEEFYHRRPDRGAGNGALMRTAPVALAYLHDGDALAEAARTISQLTHFDPDAGDACVLWCAAIRHAVLTGEFDVRIGLGHIDSARRDLWAGRLDEAEQRRPSEFADNNGWVVAALQAAWSAITTTPVPADDPAADTFRVDHLRLALENAVRGGGDTDTVAAIAGGLLGARYGASAVPADWRIDLKGWPGLNARLLVDMAETIVGAPKPSGRHRAAEYDRPRLPVRHPHDDGVWLGGVVALRNPPTGVNLPPDVDVAISLCRVDDSEIPGGITHLDLRIDDKIPHLAFAVLNAVRAVEQARVDGQTVYLHCEHAVDRTPAVAALYGARCQGIPVEQALTDVVEVLPGAEVPAALRSTLQELAR